MFELTSKEAFKLILSLNSNPDLIISPKIGLSSSFRFGNLNSIFKFKSNGLIDKIPL